MKCVILRGHTDPVAVGSRIGLHTEEPIWRVLKIT